MVQPQLLPLENLLATVLPWAAKLKEESVGGTMEMGFRSPRIPVSSLVK